jgi:hypothetical protein
VWARSAPSAGGGSVGVVGRCATPDSIIKRPAKPRPHLHSAASSTTHSSLCTKPRLRLWPALFRSAATLQDRPALSPPVHALKPPGLELLLQTVVASGDLPHLPSPALFCPSFPPAVHGMGPKFGRPHEWEPISLPANSARLTPTRLLLAPAQPKSFSAAHRSRADPGSSRVRGAHSSSWRLLSNWPASSHSWSHLRKSVNRNRLCQPEKPRRVQRVPGIREFNNGALIDGAAIASTAIDAVDRFVGHVESKGDKGASLLRRDDPVRSDHGLLLHRAHVQQVTAGRETPLGRLIPKSRSGELVYLLHGRY